MYSDAARSDEYKRRLIEFIKREYGLDAVKISPAKRGYYGETWRLDTPGAAYFVKLVYTGAHIALFERSFQIIRHLCEHGITFISKIVCRKDGGLCSAFDGAVLGVFEWIDGELTQTEATKIPEFQMLAKVYAVPAKGLAIPREEYSSACAERVYKLWGGVKDMRLRSLLEKNREKIMHRAARFKYFADACQNDAAQFYITHGDAGGNLIKDGDRHYLVDWDYPVLAPPERDAWVMCSFEWARDAFHDALRQNGISHTLRRDQLAYYCYYFFFFYLAAYLDGYRHAGEIPVIEDFIDNWIKNSIMYADKMSLER